MRLRGCRALITGGSSGIGAATAVALAESGASTVLAGRDPVRLARVAERTGATVLAADLLTATGLRTVCAAAAGIDLLVHSAGRGWAGELATMPDEDIGVLAELNLVVPLRLTRAALAGMRARGRGHLVFLSSVACVGVGGEAVYSATKAGLRAFAAGLRHEVAGDGIGVSTILPGAIDTPFFRTRGAEYHRTFPRMIDASVVASAVTHAVEHDRAEVFIPRWLTLAARIHGGMPTLFHQLAGRFG